MDKYLITNRDEFPIWLRDIKQVKGISVNGCMRNKPPEQPDFDLNAFAHTHIPTEDATYIHPDVGWICLCNEALLCDSNILLHEAAHAITNQPHTIEWARTLIAIGGTLEPCRVAAMNMISEDYHKKMVGSWRSKTLLKISDKMKWRSLCR